MSGALQSTDVRFYRGPESFARAEGRLLFGSARVAVEGELSRTSRSFEQLTTGAGGFFAAPGVVGTTSRGQHASQRIWVSRERDARLHGWIGLRFANALEFDAQLFLDAHGLSQLVFVAERHALSLQAFLVSLLLRLLDDAKLTSAPRACSAASQPACLSRPPGPSHQQLGECLRRIPYKSRAQG